MKSSQIAIAVALMLISSGTTYFTQVVPLKKELAIEKAKVHALSAESATMDLVRKFKKPGAIKDL
jgi:hypothetical protein